MPLGYSFAPTQAAADQTKAGGAPAFGAQGALKTLNFSIPKVTGAAGLSPLVGDQPSGAGISVTVLESVLRTVLGPDHAAMVMSPPQGPQDAHGGDDQGLAQLLASLGGGGGQAPVPQQATPAPVIHPGQEPNPEGPRGTGALYDPPPTQTDTYQGWAGHEASLNNRQTPNFGGGWRAEKYQGDTF